LMLIGVFCYKIATANITIDIKDVMLVVVLVMNFYFMKDRVPPVK
jgi:hypothetical protein